MSDRWLSVEEIAEYLGVSKDTVYTWINKRNMPASLFTIRACDLKFLFLESLRKRIQGGHLIRLLVLSAKRPPAPLLVGILRRTVDHVPPLNGLALWLLHLRRGLPLSRI